MTFLYFFGTFSPLYPFIIAMTAGTYKKPVLRQTDLTIDEAEQSNRLWNGLIEDIHLYHYAMTSEEIAAITKNATMLLFK